MSNQIRAALLAAALGVIPLGAAPPEPPPHQVRASEAALKAAYIYNFAKFVEWPADAVPPAALTIDVIEDPALAAALTSIVAGKRAQGRAIEVHVTERAPGIDAAQIAVIGPMDDAALGWELRRIGDRPVLTVGQSPRFLQLGGMVRFRLAGSQLQFDINHAATERGRLRFSAQLLDLLHGRSK